MRIGSRRLYRSITDLELAGHWIPRVRILSFLALVATAGCRSPAVASTDQGSPDGSESTGSSSFAGTGDGTTTIAVPSDSSSGTEVGESEGHGCSRDGIDAEGEPFHE